MREKGISAITIGTNSVTSQEAIDLAEAQNDVYATVGFHPGNLTSSYEDPHETRDPNPYSADRIRSLAESSKRVVAIGEVGLDYSRLNEHPNPEQAKDIQRIAFVEQIGIACALDLPLVIHVRDAFDDLISILSSEIDTRGSVPFVIHCFTGDWTLAERLLNLGGYLSFTGIVTFKPRAKDDPELHVHRVIERMPLDRIMLETDAPWLAPDPHRGQQNEPVYVEFIAQKVADLRHLSLKEIAEQTTKNATDFFNLPI